MNWEVVTRGFQIFAAISALIMNYILIKIIRNHSPKSIGEYKFLMLFIAVFEVFYAVLDLILQPCSLHVSLLDCLWKNTIFELVQRKKIFVWLIGPFLSGFIWAVVGYFLCCPRKTSTDYLRDNVKGKLDLNIDEIVYFAPYFYEKNETGQAEIYWPSFVGITLDSISINISLIISIYFGIKCWRRIHAVISSSSPNIQNFENQLFYALVAQTFIPIFLMHIPALAMFMFSFFELNAGHFSGIVSMTIALFPALDPIPTILIIPNYRNAVANFFKTRIQKFKKRFGCLKVKKRVNPSYNSNP
uniref:Seven TM Receptor n=1 Tax=Caenorhabditis tropicalis TaxID=1561998 RepID=A0A1I7V1S4_9PELO